MSISARLCAIKIIHQNLIPILSIGTICIYCSLSTFDPSIKIQSSTSFNQRSVNFYQPYQPNKFANFTNIYDRQILQTLHWSYSLYSLCEYNYENQLFVPFPVLMEYSIFVRVFFLEYSWKVDCMLCRRVNTTSCDPDQWLEAARPRWHPHKKINK